MKIKSHHNLNHKHIHFVGIGGSGMIALAQFLRSYGKCKVSGSDIFFGKSLKELHLQGVKIFKTHKKENLKEVDMVVYSTAIPESNIELETARNNKVPCLHRSEFLALIMNNYPRKAIIAGTHGKTTTTGMLIHILDVSGVIPSFMIGGKLPPYNINGRFSDGSTFITEADESDASFLNLDPNFCVITNIEAEHLNYYKTEENLFKAFEDVIKKTHAKNGVITMNADDIQSKSIINKNSKLPICTYAINQKDARYIATNIVYNNSTTEFKLYESKEYLGVIKLKTLGLHNIYNALAAISISLKMNISLNSIQEGLYQFTGVKRRLELISDTNDILVFDDYAHHPTEIKTTIEGLKKAQNRPITCIFQPHRYSRTKDHLEEFGQSFKNIEKLIICSIYTANENIQESNLIDKLIKEIETHSNLKVNYFKDHNDVVSHLVSTASPGDTVLTMGAGNVHEIATKFTDSLQR